MEQEDVKQQLKETETSVEDAEERLRQLEHALDKARLKTRRMEQDIQLFEQSHKRGYLYLEQMRARRMSVWWMLLVLATLTATFGSFEKHNYVLTLLNGLSFLLVWRGLYVNVNLMPTVCALVVMGATLKFG